MTPDHTPSSPTVGAETTEQHLARFYVELKAWIDGGARHHMIFRADVGLCRNLVSWGLLNGKAPSALDGVLNEQFTIAGLDGRLPFNTSYRDYHGERDRIEIYTNPARLAWIKAHASSALSNGEHSRGGEADA